MRKFEVCRQPVWHPIEVTNLERTEDVKIVFQNLICGPQICSIDSADSLLYSAVKQISGSMVEEFAKREMDSVVIPTLHG